MKFNLVFSLSMIVFLTASVGKAEHEEVYVKCSGVEKKADQDLSFNVAGIFKHHIKNYLFSGLIYQGDISKGLLLSGKHLKTNANQFKISDPLKSTLVTFTLPQGKLDEELLDGQSALPFVGASVTFSRLYGQDNPSLSDINHQIFNGETIQCEGILTNNPTDADLFFPKDNNSGAGVSSILRILLNNLGAFQGQ